MPEKMKFYIVRAKTGEVYRRNGMFYGSAQFRAYVHLNAAKGGAIALAKYCHEKMYVADENGKTILIVGSGGIVTEC